MPPRSPRDLLQGILLGVLLTALLAGAYLIWGRPARPQIVVHQAGDAPPVEAASTVPPALPTPTPTLAPVVVFVSGAVATPGVYALPAGARMQDALAAAGGALPTADSRGLNLAVLLRDEMQIYVPAQGEEPPATQPPPPPPGGDRTLSLNLAGPINLNSATQAELESLPGIGPAKAEAIIAARPFASVDDLDRVPGIGPATLEELRPHVTAP